MNEFIITYKCVLHNCKSENNIKGICEFNTNDAGYTTVRCRYCQKEWGIDEFIKQL